MRTRAADAVRQADGTIRRRARRTRAVHGTINAALSALALTLLGLAPMFAFPAAFLHGQAMRFGVTFGWCAAVLLASIRTVTAGRTKNRPVKGRPPLAGSPSDRDQPAGAAAAIPRQRAATRSGLPRIVIISASVGAGHDGAAAQLALRLSAQGFPVDRHDLLDLFPARFGRAVSAAYHALLTVAPWVYQRIYAGTEHTAKPGPLTRAVLRSTERGILGVLPPDTGAVVATYFGASQVLGRLRLRGRLAVPVFTYLTDFSVHPLWVAEGVDAHLAAHAVPAAQAQALGATRVTVAGPVVDPRFTPATAEQRQAARDRFDLPQQAPLALLVAGSWGVGPVQQVAAEIRDTGAAVPVVVCGRNEALARRLRASGFEHIYGWVDDMPGLMHAADLLVQNAGGLTSLEAFASGLPVVSYRCIPGHGQTNAAALDQARLAPWIREPAGLGPALAQFLGTEPSSRQRNAGLALFKPGAGPAEAIAHAAATPEPATATADSLPRRRSRRRLSVAAGALAGIVWLATGGTEMAVAYGGVGTLDTHRTDQTYLTVHLPIGQPLDKAVLRELAAAHAAIAVDTRQAAADPAQVRELARSGLTLINAGFGPPYATGVITHRESISAGAAALRRLTGTDPAFYLSSSDLDAVDLGLARFHHEHILVPHLRLPCDATGSAPRPGQAVLLECGTATPAALAAAVHHLLFPPSGPAAPLAPLTGLLKNPR